MWNKTSSSYAFGLLKTCPVCGKTYAIYNFDEHAYKILKNNNRMTVCSWGCVRKYEKEHMGKYELWRKQSIQRQLQGLPDVDYE